MNSVVVVVGPITYIVHYTTYIRQTYPPLPSLQPQPQRAAPKYYPIAKIFCTVCFLPKWNKLRG